MGQKPLIRKSHRNIGKNFFYHRIIKINRKENGEANSEALFRSVDVDSSGTIEEEEWLDFFKVVKAAGYEDKEIEDEVYIFTIYKITKKV